MFRPQSVTQVDMARQRPSVLVRRPSRGSGRSQEIVPITEVGIEDPFAYRFEPVNVLDRLNGGNEPCVGLVESLGPLPKQQPTMPP